MSRATTIGPVSITRVFTGYARQRVRRISAIGWLRSIATDGLALELVVGDLREVLRGIGLELLEEHAVGA